MPFDLRSHSSHGKRRVCLKLPCGAKVVIPGVPDELTLAALADLAEAHGCTVKFPRTASGIRERGRLTPGIHARELILGVAE